MNHTVLKRILRKPTFVLMAILLFAAPSFAATFNLRAAPTTVIMPDGNPVVMWGFCQSANNPADCTNFTVPGPLLTVPVGDSNLTINLKNDLPVATSLVIPGLQGTLALVTFTDAQGRDRVRSFAAETAAAGSGTYTFTAKPGTYLYQSGTHPAVQVQMGLYGAVKNDAASGQAYAGKAYNSEVVLLYSEIDSALHDAVANNRYGQPVPPGIDPALYPSSTLDYRADYFLINGQPFQQGMTTPLPAADAGQTTLIRFLNAGLRSHIPTLLGSHMKLIAEDGNLYPYSREQYSVLLPAGKTIDALWTPIIPGTYPLYDRTLHLTTGGQPGGGMLAQLQVGGTAPNVAPVAYDAAYTTNKNTLVAVTLTASDSNGDPLTYTVLTNPTNGALSGAAPNLTYTPAPNYSGPDSFTFKANDGAADSNVATVSITVTNNAPVANGQAVATNEDTALGIVLTATDADGDALTYTVVTPPAHGALSGTIPNLTYTPAANYNGSDSFTFKANDGFNDSNIATVTITVNPVSEAPVANSQAVATSEDTAIGITLTATDADGDALTYSVVAGPGNGTLVGTAPNLTYTPNANFNGMDSFTFKANDGIIDSNIATVTITVNPVNDPPVANGQAVATNEDTAIGITLTATDADGDALTYSVVAGPGNGTLVGTAPNLTYTPNANFNGMDSFTFKANDGTADSNVATVSITINAVDDQPVAVNDEATTRKWPWYVDINVLANDYDPDGPIDRTKAEIKIVQKPPGTSGEIGIVKKNRVPWIRFKPRRGFTGTATFTYTFTYLGVTSNVATVTVTVTP